MHRPVPFRTAFDWPARPRPSHRQARTSLSSASEIRHIGRIISGGDDTPHRNAGAPEEARAVLDPVLERMMEAVHRYGGTVNQVMGDGIMALFGAPVAQEDHAVRACHAALLMQQSMKAYDREARSRTGRSLQIRVGLNSGDVVVRSIGNDLHLDYTAVGE